MKARNLLMFWRPWKGLLLLYKSMRVETTFTVFVNLVSPPYVKNGPWTGVRGRSPWENFGTQGSVNGPTFFFTGGH